MPPDARHRRRRRALAGAGLLAGAWAATALPLGRRADVAVGAALRRAGSRRWDRAVVASTDLGSLYAVAGATAVLSATGRRDDAADVAGIGAAAWTLSQAMKLGVGRQRPYEADGARSLLRPPTGSSFPSGHAAVAAALAAVLGDGARGPGARAALALLGPYVAVSRVYAGVHYPTDVLGGAGAGLLLAAAWPSVRTAAGSCRPASAPSPRSGRRSRRGAGRRGRRAR